MKKVVALYLDRLNREMENMLIGMCPEDVDLRFLDPVIGQPGQIEEADCVFDTLYEVTREVIDSAPHLKLIQRTGVGVDMVDVAYAKEKGIPISICKGFNSNSVADLAVAGMLALYRKLIPLDKTTKEGRWETWKYRTESFELAGKTVGVVGAGQIGRRVAKRVQAFEAKVVYYDVFRMDEALEKELDMTYMALDELLQVSDIVTLHVPLLPETRGLIGRREIGLMKASALLINTARGPLVDQDALVEALKVDRLGGVFLDAFNEMPVTAQDPLFEAHSERLIAVPHIGAATYDNYYKGYSLCLENAQRIGRGEEPLFTI